MLYIITVYAQHINYQLLLSYSRWRFKDIDGHLFEVDYEQSWKFDEQHRLIVDEMNP